MINITATDVQTTGLAWASADMILIIWVNYVFSNSGIKTPRNKTTLTIISRHDIDHLSWLCVLHLRWYDIKGKDRFGNHQHDGHRCPDNCVARAAVHNELTMRVGNVFSHSRNKTLRNNTSLTILNMTAADAQTTGLAWASADIISTIWIGCVFSNSGVLSLWNDTKFALCVLAANGINCDVWWWRTEFIKATFNLGSTCRQIGSASSMLMSSHTALPGHQQTSY